MNLAVVNPFIPEGLPIDRVKSISVTLRRERVNMQNVKVIKLLRKKNELTYGLMLGFKNSHVTFGPKKFPRMGKAGMITKTVLLPQQNKKDLAIITEVTYRF